VSAAASAGDSVRARPANGWLARLDGALGRAATAGCVASTLGFALVMLVGVFFRYALNDSLSWADELALILFMWSTATSIAVAYRADQHVRIDVLVGRLTGSARRVLETLVEGLTGGFLLCLLVSGVEAIEVVARARTAALQWPQTVPFVALPLAAGLMLVHWLARLSSCARLREGALRLGIAIGVAAVFGLPFWNALEPSVGVKAASYLVGLLALLIAGVPVAIVLGLIALAYVAADGGMPFGTLALQMFFGTSNLTLMAIPLLIVAGRVMHASGIAERMVDFSQVLVGRMRGGLASTNVLASFLFGDVSGSAVSDTAAVGSAMIPQMVRRGYRRDFCAGLQGAAGTLGMLAPVSITGLLYATAIDVSVGRLAAAMIVPAMLTALSFMLWGYLHSRHHGYPVERVARGHRLPRVARALPGLSAIVLVVGGLLGGVFTPAEIGAVLLAYVSILGLSTRAVRVAQLPGIVVEAAHTSGMTLFLVGASAFLGFVMAHGLVSEWLLETVRGLSSSRYVALLVVSLVFIVLGMVLEAPAIIFGFLPAFVPLVVQSGFDLVHFGVLFAINMGIGMLVPPVALNLFVSSRIAGVTYGQAVRAAVPFVLIMAIDSILIVLWPSIALWLPGLLFGGALR
jgi:C4-dicarboxylate transporter DctM subunit